MKTLIFALTMLVSAAGFSMETCNKEAAVNAYISATSASGFLANQYASAFSAATGARAVTEATSASIEAVCLNSSRTQNRGCFSSDQEVMIVQSIRVNNAVKTINSVVSISAQGSAEQGFDDCSTSTETNIRFVNL